MPGNGTPTVCSLTVSDALGRAQRRVLGLAVELAQVQSQRPEEQEDLLADGFARGIGMPGARQAELVLDGPVDEQLAHGAPQALPRVGPMALQAASLELDGKGHEARRRASA